MSLCLQCIALNEEEKLCFRDSERTKEYGWIGYLRGDFGRSGEEQYSASDLKHRFGKIEYTVPFSSTIREQYMVGSLTEQTKDKKFNSAFESIKERLVR